MSSAIYYIAAVLSVIYAASTALQATAYLLVTGFDSWTALLSLTQPILFSFAGYLFYKKYKMSSLDESKYDKYSVISTVGIITFIIGCIWLAVNVKLFIETTQMNMKIDIAVAERVIGPMVMISMGVYYGYFYSKRPC